MTRYLVVHGHFYQPPRENPWLEAIEIQDSAYPFHDWNERITAECYAANAASRILDGEGRIVTITNNYARMSFNFGPTLLAWLEDADRTAYRAIVDADRESGERFGGHGSAMAQAYNHMIMPLANERDRRTQVLWGIRDFEHRFGRAPEGMWLPETAVDTATLELLAEHGIRFTILAPRQARRVREPGGEWRDASGGAVDPRRPYRAVLPSGRELALFFYDGPISQAIAFERLLESGERLAGRLLGGYADGDGAQLVHVATDGETYGHHHRHGDMALAWALHRIETGAEAELTNYGRYLELHPPALEAEIIEDTSWSCVHGVGRWREDCGCSSGMHPGFGQAWRAPLREALDWLRDTVAPRYEELAGELLEDPWKARDEYVEVVLDRSFGTVERFLDRHSTRPLTESERSRALELLELQRHAMLMYTSCGWFFDDLAGIETVQVIQYAGRVVQLAEDLFGDEVEEPFLERLARARSNVPARGDGRAIYLQSAGPAAVDLAKVAAHFGMTSLFEDDADVHPVYCYVAEREEHRTLTAGVARLAVGRVRITSQITRSSGLYAYAAIHLGDHNLNGGVREFTGDEEYAGLVRGLSEVFATGEFANAIRWLDGYFGVQPHSLKTMFRDEQRRVLDRVLGATLNESEAAYRQLYEHHAPLMRFLADTGVPLPRDLRSAAEIVVNVDLRRHFEAAAPQPERVREIFEGTAHWRLELDVAGLAFALRRTLERLAGELRLRPRDQTLLWRLDALVELAGSLPFDVDLWRVQNAFYDLLQTAWAPLAGRAGGGDAGARSWVEDVRSLGEKLSVRVP